MKTLIAIVEGQTEEKFIKDILAPRFISENLENYICIEPRLVNTSKNNKGGAINYERFKNFFSKTLKSRKDIILTTFFDLYALDNSFPGFDEISKINSPQDKAKHLEKKLHEALTKEFDIRTEKFFPHIQPYEYEALLFSDIESFIQIEPEWKFYAKELIEIRKEFASPEHINNSYETAPSKRLASILVPKYRKTLHGPNAVAKIGLDKIEQECEHFKTWLDKIRSL